MCGLRNIYLVVRSLKCYLLSWKVQREIISFLGNQIQEKIVSDVAERKYFLILADETANVSHIKQLIACSHVPN